VLVRRTLLIVAILASLLLVSYGAFRAYAIDVVTWSLRHSAGADIETIRYRGIMLDQLMSFGIGYREALGSLIVTPGMPIVGRIACAAKWPGAAVAQLCHLPVAVKH